MEIQLSKGRPLNKEELEEWKKAFSDIEESISMLKEVKINESSKNRSVRNK